MVGCIAIAWLLLLPAAPFAADRRAAPAGVGGDRLDRFRELAETRLAAAGLDDGTSPDAYRDIWALLDDEIVDNLRSGTVFATRAFLQDRLEAFGEAWGGAVFRLLGVGRFLVGAFFLGDGVPGSVRVYGALEGQPALLSALTRDGRPILHPLPATTSGAGQFLIAWEGGFSGWGTRALRLDVVREEREGARVTWSSAEAFPSGLSVRDYRVRGQEVALRYEVRYPGWTPGCEGQTEEEATLRLAPARGSYVRSEYRQHEAWHRTLHQTVARLVDALGHGKAAEVASLVPDRELRSRLPADLRAEAACDARDPEHPDTVSVAAFAAGQPWALVWQRAGERWRLVSASPVIE